jgi:lambda family phage portal protein
MAKRTPITGNLLDRAIEAISPRWAFNRMRDRAMMSMAGGYIGGSMTRPALTNYRPGAGDPNEELSWDLPVLRARSRDLSRNAPIATGAINTQVTNVVGTGLSLQSRIQYKILGLTEEQAEDWQENAGYRFNCWFESTECDITGAQNGYGLQELAFRSMMESGDLLAPIVNAPNNRTCPIALQLVEADRIMNPGNKPNSANLIEGVVLDGNGRATGYYVSKTHPGALLRRGAQEFTLVPAYTPSGRRAALHLFERKRPGQHRGVPYLAPIIEPLKQLDRYTEAELAAAVTNAVHAFFIKMDPDAFHELFDESGAKKYVSAASKWDGSLPQADLGHPGKVINLLPGEEVIQPDQSRPNDNFDPFVIAILTQIGASLELPREVLMKVFNSSYSAARAALLDAWRVFRKRRAFLATYFCQPIYEAFLDEEVAAGRIVAPGYFSDPYIRAAWCGAVWVGDGMGAIDPYKEIQAAKMRIEEEVSTRDAESIAYDGVPWETKHRQRVKEEGMRRKAGLASSPMPPDPPVVAEGDA